MMKRCCESCVYAVTLKDAERELLVCTDRPGEAGSLSIVQAGDVCRRFRRRWAVRLKPPEPPSDDVRYIPLTKGLFAIVDAADYERVSRHKWCATGSGSRAYACRSVNGKHLSMHRFLMNPPKGMVVDHIDGNRLNNRRSNLRICTVQQNTWNSRPKGKSSRYKGVCRDKDKKKWVVYVRRNGHNWYMGRFDVEIEAARAYDRKAFELFGEYAWLNFPEEYGMSLAQRRLRKRTTVEARRGCTGVRPSSSDACPVFEAGAPGAFTWRVVRLASSTGCVRRVARPVAWRGRERPCILPARSGVQGRDAVALGGRGSLGRLQSEAKMASRPRARRPRHDPARAKQHGQTSLAAPPGGGVTRF